jgi:hypothetical protein
MDGGDRDDGDEHEGEHDLPADRGRPLGQPGPSAPARLRPRSAISPGVTSIHGSGA